jgi:hypothetical protein
MRARPKPWEQASPLQSSSSSYFQLPAQVQGQGQISPTLLQYQHQHQSYGSSSTNSPIMHNHNPNRSARSSYDGLFTQAGSSSNSYNPSPNYATSGPTISPGLSFDAFNLDPDYSCFAPGATNVNVQMDPISSTSGTRTTSSSSFPYNTRQTSFDDASYGNYLNVDDDPTTNPNPNQELINLAPPGSPRNRQTSNSTPAAGHINEQGEWTTNDTPASSYSI